MTVWLKFVHVSQKKLGFENFVEVAYLRLRRTDYNAKDVANYRKQIFEEIVPIVEELKKAQAKRLGLEKLSFHDEGVTFKSGNPTPKGDRPTTCWLCKNNV